MSWEMREGDCRDVLAELPAGSVQCVVTSPPYWGLRDYGIEPTIWGGEASCAHEWSNARPIHKGGPHGNGVMLAGGRSVVQAQAGTKDIRPGAFCAKCGAWRGCLGLEPTPELYVAHLVEIFRALRRVLRDDGTVWLNVGDCYDSGTRATRDCSRNTKHGYWENPAINQRTQGGVGAKQLLGIPWRVAFALQADGWWLRQDIIWAKPNPMPESVTDRPTRAHEYVFLLTKSARYFYDAEAIKEPGSPNTHSRGKAGLGPEQAEIAYKTQAFGEGNRNNPDFQRHMGDRPVGTARNCRSVWTIPTQPFPEAHFATFPEKLVEPCIKAGTSDKGCCVHCGKPWVRIVEKYRNPTRPGATGKLHKTPDGWDTSKGSGGHGSFHRDGREKGRTGYQHKKAIVSPVHHPLEVGNRDPQRHTTDTMTVDWRPGCECEVREPFPCMVVDPFAGAGTVGVVARRLGRRFIGIEIKPEYAEMARRRIRDDAPLLNMAAATEVTERAEV